MEKLCNHCEAPGSQGTQAPSGSLGSLAIPIAFHFLKGFVYKCARVSLFIYMHVQAQHLWKSQSSWIPGVGLLHF